MELAIALAEIQKKHDKKYGPPITKPYEKIILKLWWRYVKKMVGGGSIEALESIVKTIQKMIEAKKKADSEKEKEQ